MVPSKFSYSGRGEKNEIYKQGRLLRKHCIYSDKVQLTAHTERSAATAL